MTNRGASTLMCPMPHRLMGMRLLDSHSLYIEVEDGGRVVIQARE